MAECKYIYKLDDNEAHNLEFTELQLLDHINLIQPYIDNLLQNDIVFSGTLKDAVVGKLIEILKEARKLNISVTVNEDTLNQELDSYKVNSKNYMGVTGLLQGMHNSKGRLLFPEFRSDNYWELTKKRWESPEGYTEEEKEILFEKVNGVYVIDLNIPFEEKKTKITEQWKAQAFIGTNIHKVMLVFFSYKRKNAIKQTFRKTDEEILKDVLDDKDLNLQYINEGTINLLIQFGRAIIDKFGTDANYFPEFLVTAKTTFTNAEGNQLNLLGIIDLLIVDRDGKVHIIDYKTSPHDYIDYPSEKKLTFHYLMATYSRALSINGINDAGSSVYVAPIKIVNLRKEGDKFVYDGISYMDKLFEKIEILSNSNMLDNIDEFLPQTVKAEVVPEDVLQGELKFMSTFFPDYTYGKEYTDKDISKILEGRVKYNEETGYYVYTPKNGGESVSAQTEEQLFTIVKKKYNNATRRRRDYTISIKNKVKEVLEALSDPDEDNLTETPRIEPITSKLVDSEYGDINWLNKMFSKYFSTGWKVYDGDIALDALGVIIFENVVTGQIDVVRIVQSELTLKVKLLKGKYITGTFLSDILEDSKPNSMMLDSIVANVEYMDTMYILNLYHSMFAGKTLGLIQVINPIWNTSVFASNELLLYTWNTLHSLDKSFENHFSKDAESKISYATHWDLCHHRLLEIMGNDRISKYYREKWEVFKPIVSKMEQSEHDAYDDVLYKRDLLVLLKEEMETSWPGIETLKDYDNSKNPEVGVYQTVIMAIGEADEIKLKLTYLDRSNFIDSANILTKGWLGLETDNPGNLADENLNNITKIVMQVYQNVKDFIHNLLPELRQHLNEFKEGMNFSLFKERTTGNLANLYKNMVYVLPETGNILLKNPWKNDHPEPLSEPEVKFLKYFLTEINKDRTPYLSGKALLEARDNSTGTYFYLPLARGDAKSAIAVKGLLPALKDRIKRWSPKRIAADVREAAEGFFSDDEVLNIESGKLFQMTNTFNRGYSDARLDMISQQEEGLAHWEINLETLLLKHKFAYTMLKYMDEAFPSIQAIMTHLIVSASHLNTNYPHLTKYVENYIKSKIFNKLIDDSKFDTMAAYSKKAMMSASWLALAFNPRQLYQGLEGIWKDVSLFIRKPDGTHNFSFGNLKDAFLSTLPEMIDFSQGKTKWEQLNDLYGLNDRDMNMYIDRIKSDNSGIFGAFERMSYKFASRPDFYNRATIFGAQMRGDLCWDAHVMENGKLVYKMELDGRFKEFWTGDKSDMQKYNNQKALYIAMAKLMELEKVRNADGTLFRMKSETGEFNALPKAYTIQQSEGYKDVADSIYGYYSHEKRALMLSYHLGAMIMLMNTYWSAKKNQYLAPGSIKLQGKMVHYSEKRIDADGNEREVFFYTDESGEIFDEDTMKLLGRLGIPYYAWKGQFQEGIVVTMTQLLNFTNGDFKDRWMQIWNNPDEGLRRTYRANIGLLLFDLFMLLIMGKIVAAGIQQNAKEFVKSSNNPIAKIGVNYAADLFNLSFVDFNPVSSIFGRGTKWTPFAISKLDGLFTSWIGVIGEDPKRVRTALLNSMGATRLLKPAFVNQN